MTTWWVKDFNAQVNMPVFFDFNLSVDFDISDTDYLCAREQLWAIQEGLADDQF